MRSTEEGVSKRGEGERGVQARVKIRIRDHYRPIAIRSVGTRRERDGRGGVRWGGVFLRCRYSIVVIFVELVLDTHAGMPHAARVSHCEVRGLPIDRFQPFLGSVGPGGSCTLMSHHVV